MAKACRACAIAANWTAADPATISPSMVVTGSAALEAVLTGSLVNPDQTASVGCNVKWNPGHEPEWFG